MSIIIIIKKTTEPGMSPRKKKNKSGGDGDKS